VCMCVCACIVQKTMLVLVASWLPHFGKTGGMEASIVKRDYALGQIEDARARVDVMEMILQ